MAVKLNVNGEDVSLEVAPEMPLLWALRDELQLSGTKYGCGVGLCGACTVHVDGKAVRSCMTLVSDAVGKPVTTIEGLSPDGKSSRAGRLARTQRAAMRLLPGGPDHAGVGSARRKSQSERSRKSSPACRATSAAAAATSASSPPSATQSTGA